MIRLERISRPVVGDELAQWIGRVARERLHGEINPNRWLSYRPVTPYELRAAPDLEEDDVEALRAWLAGYNAQYPTIDDVALIEARPRRPGVVVVNLGRSAVLTQDRVGILAGIGGILWTDIPQSDDPRPGIMLAQIVDPKRADNQQLARLISGEMSDAPAMVTLGGLQMAIRTDRGLAEL